jgi:hypothetical protein
MVVAQHQVHMSKYLYYSAQVSTARTFSLSVLYIIRIYTYKNGCVCVFVCSGITLERLERFQPNLVHILLYVCVRILCVFYLSI